MAFCMNNLIQIFFFHLLIVNTCVKITKKILFLDIKYLRSVLPGSVEDEFFDYLKQLHTKNVTLYAIEEGTVVFPKVPLITVKGPLPIVQLMETPLLNLVNYARYCNFMMCFT